jgi:uncharacterized RDD family membrane protein YckC
MIFRCVDLRSTVSRKSSFTSMQWYYVVNGQRLGPVAQPEFDQLVQSGVINANTLVWRQGMEAWQPYAVLAPAAAGTVTPDGQPAGAEETEICVASGKRYPKREMIQFQGNWVSGEHRDAYFQRLREGVTQPGSFTYGNFGRRFVAKILDGIILGVGGVVINMAIGLGLYGSANYFKPDVSQITMTTVILFQVISFLVNTGLGLGYGIFFLRRYNATPGKLALGLQVVRPDGSTLSVGRIIGRYFAEILSGMILLIGYIMAGFDEERRALHDRICETRVIKIR